MEKEIKYPKGETVWVSHYSLNGLEYIITTKANNREIFYLYSFDGKSFTKFAKSKSPNDLEAKYEKEVRNVNAK